MELLENDLMEGSSGRFGKRLIYRQLGAKTIIARRPARKRNPKTSRQVEVRNLFSEGVLYAKAVIADEVKKALYQAKVSGNQSAFNLALSDFCKAPEIRKYNVAGYTGQISDKISIRVFDDFKSKSQSFTANSSLANWCRPCSIFCICNPLGFFRPEA